MKKHSVFIALIALITPLMLASQAYAEVRLPNFFGDNMVFQQGKPIRVWGVAGAGERIEVQFANAKAEAVASRDGRWLVELPAMDGGYRGYKLRVTGTNTIEYNGIQIGEVWLCSGQSNMQMTIGETGGVVHWDPEVNLRAMRLITFPRISSPSEQFEFPEAVEWKSLEMQSVWRFSAIGFYFGRELNRKLDVPIGLISANWGASDIAPWMGLDQIKAVQGTERYVDTYERLAAGEIKRRPNRSPVHLYNGMILPMQHMNIRGVLWYQGESNSENAKAYRDLLPSMIAGWRQLFRDNEMPFYMVQLAGFAFSPKIEANWPKLRQSQLEVAIEDPYTGIVNAIDVGAEKNIHPKNKYAVAKRLARLALNQTYGFEKIVPNGPIYQSAEVLRGQDMGKIKIRFELYGGKLATKDQKSARCFEVAGQDGVFHPAQAELHDDYAIVYSAKVDAPVHVRYAWKGLPNVNIVGADQLPMLPFTTESLFNIAE